MESLKMSLDMRVVIFSAFLVSIAASGFVPREPTKQDIDIARIEFFKLQKSSVPSYKVVAAEDTTENNNGDILGKTIHDFLKAYNGAVICHSDDANDTIPIVVGAVLAALILVVMVSYFVLRVRANKKASS